MLSTFRLIGECNTIIPLKYLNEIIESNKNSELDNECLFDYLWAVLRVKTCWS